VAEPEAPVASKSWWVYLLRCKDDSLYTGITVDVEARLATHNAGNGARYTRSRLPVELVYSERALDRGAALRREAAIKKLSAAKKRLLVSQG
jgi:putative endonuclease